MNKLRYILLTFLLIFPVLSFAQNKPTAAQTVDSLFMRASSGMVMFRDEVEPSKKALIEMGQEAIPEMLTKMDSRSAREILTIVDIFKGIGEPAVVPLAGQLKSRDDYVRRLAIRCLGEIKSPTAISYLTPYAENNDFRTRAGVMDALGRIGDVQGAPIVTKGLFDKDEIVAYSAAVACGRIKQGIDPIALIEVLDHSYYGVRYCAMQSLVELGEASVGPLKQYLASRPVDISTGYVIEALGRLGTKNSLKPLKQTMKSTEWTIRAYTAQALGYSKNKSAIKILKKAAKHETQPLVISNIKSSLLALQAEK